MSDDDNSKNNMSQVMTNIGDETPYIIPSPLQSDTLKIIIGDIQKKFAVSDSLKIDISAVHEINFVAVQSFIAINRFAMTHHKSLKWVSPNDKFMDTFSKLGLYSEMMKMEFIS